jgi:hypothetical protein
MLCTPPVLWRGSSAQGDPRVCRVAGRTLCCERHFELRGGIVPAEQYHDVRKFINAGCDMDGSDIVLVRGKL